ncbi:MAG TPA: hypothetical protein VIW73_10590 [Candidatus Cybelea sp.]
MYRTLVAKIALTIVVFGVQIAPLSAHSMSMPAPMRQPASPVKLKSCYLGTDFTFGAFAHFSPPVDGRHL